MLQGKARAPREINPGLPAGLPEVIMQAMSVDKDKRYQTMVDLRAALKSFAETTSESLDAGRHQLRNGPQYSRPGSLACRWLALNRALRHTWRPSHRRMLG